MSKDRTKVKKCLFPAAGYGTRFLPATKAIPKEMLPVLTKPLLQHGVEEAINSGIDTMDIFEILEHTKSVKGWEIKITGALLVQAKESKVVAYR